MPSYSSFIIAMTLLYSSTHCIPIPEWVSVGNSVDTTMSLNTQNGGVNNGVSGAIKNIAASSDNVFQPGAAITQGSIEMGNSKELKVIGDTGRGFGWGSGGSLTGMKVASGNGLTGGSSGIVGSIINSNVVKSNLTAFTGMGGYYGGSGGSAENIQQSSGNNVNLNSVKNGQVGVTQSGNTVAITGMGNGHGSASGITSVSQSSNNNIK
jgi:hypothetical protein